LRLVADAAADVRQYSGMRLFHLTSNQPYTDEELQRGGWGSDDSDDEVYKVRGLWRGAGDGWWGSPGMWACSADGADRAWASLAHTVQGVCWGHGAGGGPAVAALQHPPRLLQAPASQAAPSWPLRSWSSSSSSTSSGAWARPPGWAALLAALLAAGSAASRRSRSRHALAHAPPPPPSLTPPAAAAPTAQVECELAMRWNAFVRKHPIPANCFMADACCRFAALHGPELRGSREMRQAFFSMLHCWWNCGLVRPEEFVHACRVADGKVAFK
jgi:hypothetical protein